MPGEGKDEKDLGTQGAAAGGDDTPPAGITEEEWEGLSPAEREGVRESIEDPEGDGAEGSDEGIDDETLKGIAEDGEGSPDDKKGGKTSPAKEGEKPPETPPGKPAEAPAATPPADGGQPPAASAQPPAGAAAAPPVSTTSDEDLLRFRPDVPDSALPAVDKVSPEIQAKLDDLDTKYENAELDLREYNKQRDTLNRQVITENLQAREAARAEKAKELTQVAFLQARPEYIAKDASGKDTPEAEEMFDLLNIKYNRLRKDPKYAHAPEMEVLVAADRAVKASYGIKPGASTGKPATPAASGEKKPPAEPPGHKTLTDVPAAAGNGVETGFEVIDRLQGEAYESALERMTEEQRNRYLSSR
jgi:hypothetical protein